MCFPLYFSVPHLTPPGVSFRQMGECLDWNTQAQTLMGKLWNTADDDTVELFQKLTVTAASLFNTMATLVDQSASENSSLKHKLTEANKKLKRHEQPTSDIKMYSCKFKERGCTMSLPHKVPLAFHEGSCDYRPLSQTEVQVLQQNPNMPRSKSRSKERKQRRRNAVARHRLQRLAELQVPPPPAVPTPATAPAIAHGPSPLRRRTPTATAATATQMNPRN